MIRRHTISVKNAARGVVWAFRTQPNFKVHVFLSTLAILGALFFRISYIECLIIVILISTGLVIEMINTALEATNDAISVEWRQSIKFAKDAAAGAMLIYAAGAFTCACLIFIPKIILFLGF